VDAGTLAQYRLAVMSAARQFKRYPRVARDQSWQGRVEIRLAIGSSGEISVLSVRSSTGYELLDQHALEMIERAKALVQIPPALRGKEFSMDIPVVFSLREAGG
jgi:protein TonB